MRTGDRSYWMRRTFALWNETGLPAEDRHDFAGKVLGFDVPTFRGLSVAELGRLVDALEGWHAVEVLRRQRGKAVGPDGPREQSVDAEAAPLSGLDPDAGSGPSRPRARAGGKS